jgi:S-adenosylmethionine hydrolase
VPAIITLTTDFGTRDGHVAEMKAVILGVTRDVHLVDLTHDIGPQQVLEAALVLEAATRFPPGTVHLAVVDPGVGTARRGLVVRAARQTYVGPDNGLFTAALESGPWEAFELTAPEYRLPAVSRTFHGRDVFAPAAAHLALGLVPARLGPAILDPVRVDWPRARSGPAGLSGTVIHVDRFGNLVTSITAAAIEEMGHPGTLEVILGRRRLPLVGTYGDLGPGAAGALVGSRGRLEIAVREGSAARRLGAGTGAAVRVSSTRTGSRSTGSRPARGRARPARRP